jgi:hypothetical protein
MLLVLTTPVRAPRIWSVMPKSCKGTCKTSYVG